MTKRDDVRGRGEEHEPTRITVNDKRRIDPATGQVRKGSGGGPARSGAASPNPPVAGGEEGVMPGAVDESSDEVAGGAAELAAARAETAERTADLQRITAEYANYRKRSDRDRQAAAVAGKASVVAELLAVLDDLDRAAEHGDLTGGFKTVADKLSETLARLGLSPFGAEGDEFDPNIHEAVQFTTAAGVAHPTVATVLRRGYLFDERVLRPAVVVVMGPEHEAESDSSADPASAAGSAGDATDLAGASDGDGDARDGAGDGAGGSAGVASEDAVGAGGAAESGARQ